MNNKSEAQKNNRIQQTVADKKRYESLNEEKFIEESLKFFQDIASNFKKVRE